MNMLFFMNSGKWLRVFLCYSKDELFMVENMSINRLSYMSENSCLFISCLMIFCSLWWYALKSGYFVMWMLHKRVPSGRTLNIYIFPNFHSGVTLLLIFSDIIVVPQFLPSVSLLLLSAVSDKLSLFSSLGAKYLLLPWHTVKVPWLNVLKVVQVLMLIQMNLWGKCGAMIH